MSQISQLSKLAISISVSVTAAVTLMLPSISQLPLFLSNQIMWFAISFCDWLVWCLFPPIRKIVAHVFFSAYCLQTLQ